MFSTISIEVVVSWLSRECMVMAVIGGEENGSPLLTALQYIANG